MSTKIDTIIIGGGHSGMAMSYTLLQAGREHLVLERYSQVGETWRRQRWDSFSLVIPNWSILLPGAAYDGPYPDAFMPRAEFIQHLETYASKYQMPIQFNTCVTSVEKHPSGSGYWVKTDQGDFEAQNVVIATGFFQHSKIPELASSFPAGYPAAAYIAVPQSSIAAGRSRVGGRVGAVGQPDCRGAVSERPHSVPVRRQIWANAPALPRERCV